MENDKLTYRMIELRFDFALRQKQLLVVFKYFGINQFETIGLVKVDLI